MLFKRSLSFLSVATILSLPGAASANGYQNLHQSAEGLGTAYAANGTGISDISAVFSNAASLTRFSGWNASAGVTLILPTNTFEGLSATTVAGAAVVDGVPAVPSQFLDTTVSGYWYVGKQVTDQLFLGVGFNAPWATASDYTDTAASRYTATTTELTAFNLNPMVAYKVNEKLSIAAGLNIQYYMSSFSTNLPPVPGAPSRFTDAAVTFEGNKLAFGATIGVEYQANDRWRFGASYRTSIKHEFDGDNVITGPAATLAAFAGAGVAAAGTANYDIATPWVLQLGVHGQINDRLEVFGSAALTGWSVFEDTVITTSNLPADIRVRNGWHDAVYVALGAAYQATPKTKIFGGVAFDETPTRTAIRNPRAPNAHRYYVGLGLSHEFSPGRAVKIGYAHTFFDDATIALTPTNNPGRGSLNGEIKIDADIFMLQYVHQF